MDAKDHAKITHHSGQEGHGVHVCHKCGWPFPNPHPSAKHRRAHKRVCGKVEGYKLVHSEGSTHSVVSDEDDHPSDDDLKTPSPKIVETSKKGIGGDGIGERSNRMEDEVFSDAVAEFSDSGIGPGKEQGLEDARESNKNVEKVAKDAFDAKQSREDNPITDSNTDTIEQQGDLTDSSMMGVPGVSVSSKIPMMPQDHVPYSSYGSVAGSISEDFAKESTLGLAGDGSNSACSLSAIKPQTPAETPQEDYKSNARKVEYSFSGNTGEGPIALAGDVMENEENALVGKLLEIAVSSNESAGETSQAASTSEKTAEQTLDPVAGDVIVQVDKDETDEREPKILSNAPAHTTHNKVDAAQGPYCSSGGDLVEVFKANGEESENTLVFAEKLQDTAVSANEDARETSEAGSIDIKPLNPAAVVGIVEEKEGQSDEVESKSFASNLSPDLIEHIDTSADTTHGLNLASSSDLFDSSKTEEEKNEIVHSEPYGMHSVGNPDIAVEYFNDQNVVKSDLPLTVDSYELIKDIGDRINEPVPEENLPDIQSIELASSTAASFPDVQAFEGNHKQDDTCRDPCVPVEGEAGVSEIKVPICEDLGLDELGVPAECSRSEVDKNQTICSLAEEGPYDSSKESLNIHRESATIVLPKTVVYPIDAEICQKANSSDNNSGGDHGKARIENYDMAGSDIVAEGATKDNLTENNKATSEFVGTVFSSQANQTFNLEGDDVGDLDKIKMDTYEIAGKENKEGSKEENIALEGDSADNYEVDIRKCEITGKESREGEFMGTTDIASSLSKFRVAAEDDMNVSVRNLPESEYKDLYEVSDPSRVTNDSTETHSSLQYQDKSSQELGVSKHDEVKVQCLGAVCGVTESNPDGEELSPTAENQPMEEPKIKIGDLESSVQCLTIVQENKAQMIAGEGSGISSSMKEPMHSGDVESSTIQSSAAVEDDCNGLLNADASSVCLSTKESKPSTLDTESSVQRPTIAVEDYQISGNASGIKSETLLVEGDNNSIDRQHVVLPLDVSIDSGSQSDSLEANWGSVSGLSTQSDALAHVDTDAKAAPKSNKDILNKPNLVSVSHGSDKSDVFEPPSFATLVEPAGGSSGSGPRPASSEIQTIQSQQQSKPSQAGWFPSLTNVVNESQGRKKNEEAIAKVTNWSTGKQHTPLKTLLVEATTETKPKSPTPKDNSASVVQKDDAPAKNGSAPPSTNGNSLLGAEAPSTEPEKDLGKEWNSPARYPIDSKRDKRKGRPYWAQFVCCSSVN